jgi:hypothetical protein
MALTDNEPKTEPTRIDIDAPKPERRQDERSTVKHADGHTERVIGSAEQTAGS